MQRPPIHRSPDIQLTEEELSLLRLIRFDSHRIEDLRASSGPMQTLARSLLDRRAVPVVRLQYFTDPERNPGGRGKSRKEIFNSNGTAGSAILTHPHFLPYLYYFIHGPRLTDSIIKQFWGAAKLGGYLSSSDIEDLKEQAKSCIKELRLDPHWAADEFHKLALECAASVSSAATLRQHLRSVRILKN